MPYVTFPKSAQMASLHLWIPYHVLVDLSAGLTSLNFSVVAERQNGIVQIRELFARPSIAFSQTLQFPTGMYITMNDNTIYNLLTEIINVLSYRDMQKDTADTMRNLSSGRQPVESKKDEQVGWHYNDASVSFTRKVQALHAYLKNVRNVITGPEFEAEHGLTWNVPAAP
jgi:hypothetical protein